MDINKSALEAMIKDIIVEKLTKTCSLNQVDFVRESISGGVMSVKLPTVRISESDRMDTGTPSDKVYTKDLFSLEESGRLGCGIMEMTATTFDWTLNYDEIDYVIEGTLTVIINGESVTAKEGELILIPKGSSIKFSVPTYARFIYVTYPADWASQG